MRVLALDIATTTGWALFEGPMGKKPDLLKWGKVELADVLGYHYPASFVVKARNMGSMLLALVVEQAPDMLVVEETNPGGRAGRYSQKLLEFIHCDLLKRLLECRETCRMPIEYVSSSEWRRVLNLRLSKADRKNNDKVSRAKRAGKSKKQLGLKGRITKKHLAVVRANEEYNLLLLKKDDDVADALLLGTAWFMGAKPSEPPAPKSINKP